MLIAAAIVGLATAYYFGLRHGVLAAGGALFCFVAAMVAPGIAVWAYAAVGLGLVGVFTVGPKRGNPTHAVRATRAAKAAWIALMAKLPGGKK